MALTSKNIGYTLTTSSSTIYTCPTGKTATIVAMTVNNKTASPVTATFTWIDTSNSNAEYTLLSVGSFTPNNNVSPAFGIPLVLEDGDSLKGLSSATTSIDVTLTILEK